MAKRKTSRAKQVGIGIAATAAVAAAAGAYFLYGAKDAAKNRKMVKSWTLKAKGEVLEGIEKVRSLDQKKYHVLVDRVIRKYARVRGVSAKEAATLSRELKSHWKHIHKAATAKKSASRRTTKRKTATKKTARRNTRRR